MFWADRVAEEIKKASGGKPQLVDDQKTPSGRIHVGALRGVIIHDLVFKALKDARINARYTYIIDDMDPMDDLPAYLPKDKFEGYMGMPLKDVPAPKGKGSYAEYYAKDFIEVFNKLGANPEIIWASNLYRYGKLDKAINIALDNAEKIQEIYHKISGSQKEKNWFPFFPVCPDCGKIGTTKVIGWDGKEVEFSCEPDKVEWAKGCGYKGKVSPFGGTGKLPWRVDWVAKWVALGVTVEGGGKDHASKGGARDTADAISKEVFKYNPPYNIPYEFFLFGGGKMSSSKGVGASAAGVSETLPPEVLRFLMARVQPKVAIDFDPSDINTVPALFDEYDRGQKAFFEKGDPDLSRTWEASQVRMKSVGYREQVFLLRFSQVVNLIQMPGIDIEKEAEKAKGSSLTKGDRGALRERVRYAKIWLDNFAPDAVKFKVSESLPEATKKLSFDQKKFLEKLSVEVAKTHDTEKFQNRIYQLGKEVGSGSSETFKAVYIALLGKDHGPKASSLILSLPSGFVKKRFLEASKS